MKHIANDIIESHLPSLSFFFLIPVLRLRHSAAIWAVLGIRKTFPSGQPVRDRGARQRLLFFFFLIKAFFINFFNSSITFEAQCNPSGCAGNKKKTSPRGSQYETEELDSRIRYFIKMTSYSRDLAWQCS